MAGSAEMVLVERGRDETNYYPLYNILKGFDIGILKLREIGLDIVVKIDLIVEINARILGTIEISQP